MKSLTIFKVGQKKKMYGHSWIAKNSESNVIIVTGMEEHAKRYHDFASFLNKSKMSVYSMDYYGQGENTVHGDGKLGVVPVGAFELFTEDVISLALKLKATGKPLYILGHSMGSFLTQRIVQKQSKLFDKAVIVGSNGPTPLFKLGKIAANITVTKKGRDKVSKLLASLAIGSYAKSVKNPRTPTDWISHNAENVDLYNANPLDGHPSSKGFYFELLSGTSKLYKQENYQNVRRDLPLFIIAGKDDPVGLFGKGVEKLHTFYENLGFTAAELKIYENMRHEILNETNKKEVYEDVLKFLKK
ncbi:MAG TPA: alpha/beta fold hydrolase [Bacilli bacterium]|nr:alpha/beta fold hydrolase [Bacilli bacterium]